MKAAYRGCCTALFEAIAVWFLIDDMDSTHTASNIFHFAMVQMSEQMTEVLKPAKRTTV
jgi:hypothetical protein